MEITQEPADCSNALTEKNVVLKEISFKAKNDDKIKIEGHQVVFDNSKKGICNVSKCKLMVAGCKEELNDQNINIDPSSGMVTAKANVVLGYEQAFCYTCIINPPGGGKPISTSKDGLKIT